jgi:topoisomerase IA-like protein
MGDDAASMATLEAIVAECECLEREATLVSATAGDIDTTGLDPATIALIVQLIQMFGPVVMDLVKRIIERRKNRS